MTWLVATLSLALPWVALAAGGIGLVLAVRGEQWTGWSLIGLGGVLVVADILIDLVFAHSPMAVSAEPALNRPAEQLVGRVLILVEPIAAGRGRARAGDSLWVVRGPDLPAGRQIRVVGVKGEELLVAPVIEGEPPGGREGSG